MSAAIFIVALLFVCVGAVAIFLRAEPAKLAGGLRTAGPVLRALLGAVALRVGRGGIGGLMLPAALAWFGSMRMKRPPARASNESASFR